jgi:hypothetical protein
MYYGMLALEGKTLTELIELKAKNYSGDLLKIDSSKESSRQQGVSARDFWGARRSLSSIPVSTSLRVIPLGKIEIEPMDPNDSAE